MNIVYVLYFVYKYCNSCLKTNIKSSLVCSHVKHIKWRLNIHNELLGLFEQDVIPSVQLLISLKEEYLKLSHLKA